MSSESASSSSGCAVRHVYHLSRSRLLALPLVCGVLVATLLGISLGANPTDPAESRAVLLSAGLVTFLMLPFFAIVWHARLVLSPEGIAHHQLGYTVRSSWANLEALSLNPGTETLLLREPGTHSALLRLCAKLLNLVNVLPSLAQNLESLAEGRVVLLAPFMAHWKRGQLRKDILRWAPHLFDANGQPRDVAATPHIASRR